MVDYSPWGRKELDTTERLHFMFASHVDLFFLDIFFFLILPTKKFNTTDILHIYCMCICVLLIKSVTFIFTNISTLTQFSSVAQSCPTLCNPMNCSTSGLPVHHQLPAPTKLMSIESVMPSNHLILYRPLFLLPSIFLSIRVFSNESVLHIMWPKYWSFSSNISPSN